MIQCIVKQLKCKRKNLESQYFFIFTVSLVNHMRKITLHFQVLKSRITNFIK